MLRKHFRNVISLSLVALSLAVLSPIESHATWMQNSTGWWHKEGNSWDTGWKHINEQWYYFYPSGYMAVDTVIDGYYVNSNGQWVNNSPSHKNSDKKVNSSQSYIGEEKGKQIALDHAGVNPSSVRYINSKFDYEHGIPVYEVEFKVGYKEYEYDINATTGKVVQYSNEYDD